MKRRRIIALGISLILLIGAPVGALAEENSPFNGESAVIDNAVEDDVSENSESQSSESDESDMSGAVSQSDLNETDVTEENQSSAAEEQAEQQSDVESEVEAQGDTQTGKPLAENSWRYCDGQLIDNSEIDLYGSSENAWKKINGICYNGNGDVLSGAIDKGVDVSEHQGAIDWNSVKNSDVDYAIIRCSYSDVKVDNYWYTNANACSGLGIPFGVYIYALAKTPEEAVSEANYVLNLVSGYGLTYPIYYDVEDNYMKGLSTEEIAAVVEAFCSTIQSAGYDVGVYSYYSLFSSYLTDPYFDTVERWVAAWNSTKCSYSGAYTMWQCSSKGSVPGISGNVDLDFSFVERDGSSSTHYDAEQVKAFVTRCYNIVLGRGADPNGLEDWCNQLMTGKATAAQIVNGFICSPEYLGKNKSNSETVEILYQTMLNRGSDPSGKQTWMSALEQGVSYTYLVNGFSGSQEFSNLCSNYGIRAGKIYNLEARDRNVQVTAFVQRCYEKALNRHSDVDGLNHWCEQILTGAMTPKQVAYGFVFSDESNSKNRDNSTYVKMLYQLCLGRSYDQAGYDNWIGQLNRGSSRLSVFNGFADSPEFQNIVRGYGL